MPLSFIVYIPDDSREVYSERAGKEKTLHPSRLRHSLFEMAKNVVDSPYFLLPLASLFWSGNFILGRYVRGTLPPVGLAFWRWLGASILILGFARPYLKQDRALLIRHWKLLTLLAILFLGENFELFHAAGIFLILSGIVLATRIKSKS